MALFFIPLVLAFLLVIWFDSDALIEYTDLLRIYKFVPILRNYYNIRKKGSDSAFINYLSQYYSSFFVRLIVCEICLSSWVGVLAGILMFSYAKHYGLLFAWAYTAALPYLTLFFYRLIKLIR